MNNPEPIAVALEYDGETSPTVCAQGFGEVAKKIIQIANENGVLVQQDNELVEILAQLDIGDNIPENLYRAVAEVIAFAYILSGKFPKSREREDATRHYPDNDLSADS
jgi:flagellar biosynthesis protein